MKVDGGCHCGFITYEAEADPDKVSICNCTDCQTLSGAPFRATLAVAGASFRMLSGAPTIYVKTAESGAKRKQGFCPRCGSSIYSTSLGDRPDLYFIRLGTVRQRGELVPKTQIWTRSQQPWVKDIASIPGVATQP